MDEEVHGFVHEALPPLNTWVRSSDPFIPNGSDPSAIDPSFSQHHHRKHRHYEDEEDNGQYAQGYRNPDIIGADKWPDEV